jgi:hypothetical protein
MDDAPSIGVDGTGIHTIEVEMNEDVRHLEELKELEELNKSCELKDVDKLKVIDYGIKNTYQCGRFLVLVGVTTACFALSFYMIIDSHLKGDRIPEWAIPLLTFVIGIWIPSPSWSKKKQVIREL